MCISIPGTPLLQVGQVVAEGYPLQQGWSEAGSVLLM
jgi:hypothetical protein